MCGQIVIKKKLVCFLNASPRLSFTTSGPLLDVDERKKAGDFIYQPEFPSLDQNSTPLSNS